MIFVAAVSAGIGKGRGACVLLQITLFLESERDVWLALTLSKDSLTVAFSISLASIVVKISYSIRTLELTLTARKATLRRKKRMLMASSIIVSVRKSQKKLFVKSLSEMKASAACRANYVVCRGNSIDTDILNGPFLNHSIH